MPISGYKIYRNGVLVASPVASPYTDTGLTNGTTYSYQVSAVNEVGEGPKSVIVTATPSVAGNVATFPGTGANTQSAFQTLMGNMNYDVIEIQAGTYTGWHIGGSNQTPFTVNRASRPLLIRPVANATVIFDGTGVGGEGWFYNGRWTTQTAPVGNYTFDTTGTGGQFILQNYAIAATGLIWTGWAQNIIFKGFTVRNCTGLTGGSTSWVVYVSSDGVHRGSNITFDNFNVGASVNKNVSGFQSYHTPQADNVKARNWTITGAHVGAAWYHNLTLGVMSGWAITNCDKPIVTDGIASGVSTNNTSSGSTNAPDINAPWVNGSGNTWN